MIVGVLMWLGVLGLRLVLVHFQDIGGISVSVADGGTINVSARQVWVVLSALAFLGIGLIISGIYVLLSSRFKR